ncbi:glycosyltransferase [Chlamydiota bacterium]
MNRAQITLESYRNVAPQGVVDLAYKLAEPLQGKTFLHVNSTKWGGGVAEILHNLVPLFNELGIKTRWEVLEGTQKFYKTTKYFHNGLQGIRQEITADMYEEYLAINTLNRNKIDCNADLVLIHDPQPAAFIEKRNNWSTWLWRCHIDVSRPQRMIWHFLRKYVSLYDGAIFTLPSFAQRLPIPQFQIYPSIDPLSDKNKEMSKSEINAVFQNYNIPRDKPILLQVSRFDRFKDPLGVIEAYKMVKKYNDCYLILAGGGAADDPEGKEILEQVHAASEKDPDVFILDLPPDSHTVINALQRGATIILQKSTKEGFGLTVSEAMWKGKPVIGGAVGGITAQLIHNQTGFTISSVEGCAYRIRYLLNNKATVKRIGKQAQDFARRNLLITRHLCDYLALMISVTKQL